MEFQYEIQWRVETLAHIAMSSSSGDYFLSDEILFSHWDQWPGHSDFWLAKGDLVASNLNDAISRFYNKLANVIPRISLISQCYIEFISQPFLVKRSDKEFAYFRYTCNSESVGLTFGDEEEKALGVLLQNKEIPEAFFSYWNDAVNVTGYSSKLLIMFSAIDAYVKTNMGECIGKTKREKREWLLGTELTDEIFGVAGRTNEGLRNRLVHGEYFNSKDEKNYLDLVHQRIILHLNSFVLREKLLAENVVGPQRHPWGNREGDEIFGGRFIKAIGEKTLDVKEVLSETGARDSGELESYEYIYDNALTDNY